jgi:hypothetical protein
MKQIRRKKDKICQTPGCGKSTYGIHCRECFMNQPKTNRDEKK